MNANEINLAGTWEFSLGESPAFDSTIRLPGSLQEQGFGHDVTVETPWTGQIVDQSWFTSERYAPYRRPGNVRVPFWLQPVKHYVGAAWYRRTVSLPPEWSDRRVVLTLERPHIQSTVFLDGREVGSGDSLATPHVYDLGHGLAAGEHEIAIRVDNRMPVDIGVNSHSVSDHTQSNWNGIVGRIRLSATTRVWIEDAQVYPDIAGRNVRLTVRVGNATGKSGAAVVRVGEEEFPVRWDEEGGATEFRVRFAADAALWDEFSPVLQTLSLHLLGEEADDAREIAFGLRQVSVDGTRIAVNGRPIFLRGTLECAVFPKTGYPPTDGPEWSRILSMIKDYGFNHVRFHSWCPPEAAFAAADRLGLYLQVECSSWANVSTKLGMGLPVDEWLYREAAAILKAYGNHPSFVLMAYGNEPAGRHQEYLAKWVTHWKQADPRRLHTSGAGWPSLPGNDFDNTHDPRIHRWGERLTDRLNQLPPATIADYSFDVASGKKPIVSHEIGQWCVYPDFSEIPKYTGVLRARNFEIFRDSLAANHMGDQAADFVQASGRLQMICYREEIESSLRTPGFGGFQILQMNDFPGQGTALVGWMNPFWESKGYASAEEVARFNSATVLLARLEKRVFSTRMTLHAAIEAAHFGPEPTPELRTTWKLVGGDGVVHASGDLPRRSLPVGNGIELGSLVLPLRNIPAPAKLRLVVALEGTGIENDWEIWTYPEDHTGTAPEVEIVRDWEVLLSHAERGGRVLFVPPVEVFRRRIVPGFSTIFWNSAWTRRHAPQTLGILCDPKNPVFAGFPTEFHTNWQWWELLHGASALRMDGLPPGLRPHVQVIDDWFSNRRLGLLYEAKIGKCRAMISGMDLLGAVEARHAMRQFRRSVVAYMASDAFDPQFELDPIAVAATLGCRDTTEPGILLGEEPLDSEG